MHYVSDVVVFNCKHVYHEECLHEAVIQKTDTLPTDQVIIICR